MKKLLFISFFTLITLSMFAQRPANITLSDNNNNFKTAEPYGEGDLHNIERGRDITYTIHFQNIGLDTALNLRVLDTLSMFLDINSLREEGSSHAFNMSILGGNIVRFSFPNIRLPNIAANETTSKGYVSFTVSQKENLPLMTRITNKASIFFDFRSAISTNTVFHTIGYGSTGTKQVFMPGLTVGLFPNPIESYSVFDVQGIAFQHGELQVFDLAGRLRQSLSFQNPRFDFLPDHLSTGQFFYKISLDGQTAAAGRFLVK